MLCAVCCLPIELLAGERSGAVAQKSPVAVAGGAAANAITDSLLFQGQVLFARNCSVGYCHGKGGRAGRGPRLRGRRLPGDYLFDVIQNGISNSTMRSWGDRLTADEIRSIVAFIHVLSDVKHGDPDPVFGRGRFSAQNVRTLQERTEPIIGESSDLIGDPERGRALFYDPGDDRNCGHCHEINGSGFGIGPDLGGLATAPARMLLRDILLPNAFVIPQGLVTEMVMTRGDTIDVVRVSETDRRVKAYDITAFPPVMRSIRKTKIQSEETTRRSAMPDLYAQRYTLQQLLDLISFIKAGSGQPVVAEDLFSL